MQLSREQLLQAYRRMATIRAFEERLHDVIATGEVAGFTHLYCGQEAVAVGVCEHLDTEDKIVSTHRGHGPCRHPPFGAWPLASRDSSSSTPPTPPR